MYDFNAQCTVYDFNAQRTAYERPSFFQFIPKVQERENHSLVTAKLFALLEIWKIIILIVM